MSETLDTPEIQPSQLIDDFRHLHLELAGLVDQIPAADREKVVFDKWSVRDVLAHISAWNDLDVARATSVTRGGKPADLIPDDQLDLFNEGELAKRQGLSWDEIYQDFAESGQRLTSAFSALPENEWGKQYGKSGKLYTMKEFLRDAVDHYKTEHIPQLKNFLSRPKK